VTDDTHIPLGSAVVIRQPSGYTYTGRLVYRDALRLVIEDAAWVADSRRWSGFLVLGPSDDAEIEPYPPGPVSLPAGLCELSLWHHDLPRLPQPSPEEQQPGILGRLRSWVTQ